MRCTNDIVTRRVFVSTMYNTFMLHTPIITILPCTITTKYTFLFLPITYRFLNFGVIDNFFVDVFSMEENVKRARARRLDNVMIAQRQIANDRDVHVRSFIIFLKGCVPFFFYQLQSKLEFRPFLSHCQCVNSSVVFYIMFDIINVGSATNATNNR